MLKHLQSNKLFLESVSGMARETNKYVNGYLYTKSSTHTKESSKSLLQYRNRLKYIPKTVQSNRTSSFIEIGYIKLIRASFLGSVTCFSYPKN